MNLFRRPFLNSTGATIDKEARRWSLSWHPEGRCDSFTKGAILLFAPPTSGVYGLFNLDGPVFIGESANIQEALLRRRSETDFLAQHLRPTGFVFEPCGVELRKSKADELIAKFRPVLQAKKEKQPKVRRHFYFKRPRGAALGATFVASAAVIFNLGMPVDSAIQTRASATNPTSGQTEMSLRAQHLSSIDTDGGITNQNAEPTPTKPDIPASGSTLNIAVPVATLNTPAADREGIQPKRSRMAHFWGTANLSKKWSVQVSAAPAKDIADTVAQRLKTEGHDGYVVQAQVKGQPYYRVRVGHFDSREQAESVRQSLRRQEGYRDAYLTHD
jgi:cell division septation protein DedD